MEAETRLPCSGKCAGPIPAQTKSVSEEGTDIINNSHSVPELSYRAAVLDSVKGIRRCSAVVVVAVVIIAVIVVIVVVIVIAAVSPAVNAPG